MIPEFLLSSSDKDERRTDKIVETLQEIKESISNGFASLQATIERIILKNPGPNEIVN